MHKTLYVLGYAVVALLAGALIALYQLALMPDAQRTTLLAQAGSMTLVIAVAALQTTILTVLCSLLGVRLASHVALDVSVRLTMCRVRAASMIALVVAGVIVASDVWLFAPYLPATATPSFSWLGLASSVLYGGIIEEVLMRLGIMTCAVWLLWKVRGGLAPWMYIVAIGVSALLFAAGHLPITFQLLCQPGSDCTPLVVRALLLNGIGGVAFGYLYWRHGLSASMVAHVLTHVLMQLVFGPLLRA
jgi:hypothetical protein